MKWLCVLVALFAVFATSSCDEATDLDLDDILDAPIDADLKHELSADLDDLDVSPSADSVEVDSIETENPLSPPEVADVQVEQSTCSTCIFLPGCSGGEIVQSFVRGRG